MAKYFRIADIKLLLEHLAGRTKESLDHYGAGQMSEKIKGTISQKYLYDSLLRPVKNIKDDNEVLKLAPNKIDELARYLGYGNFSSFLEEANKSLDPVLTGLTGNYYSYVRKNCREGRVLQSPVKIEIIGNCINWILKGPEYSYQGELVYHTGCVFCLMTSGRAGKSFYHVYKVGKSISPAVLMGIFSGVSSSNDPIGGRCILVRQDIDFNLLVNRRINIQEMKKSTQKEERKMAVYFERYEDNNLKINNPYGFDIDDLET